MVVFHVSTFILHLHTPGDYDSKFHSTRGPEEAAAFWRAAQG